MKSNLVVEFGTAKCDNIYFRPLMRRMRGTFDARSLPNAGRLYRDWPQVIPGEQLEITANGDVYVVEPLHSDEFAATRERIEKSGHKIGPERQQVAADMTTVVHWLAGLVAANKCKVLSGELPKVSGEPQLRFHSTDTPDPIDRLAKAFDRLSDNLEKLLARQTPN